MICFILFSSTANFDINLVDKIDRFTIDNEKVVNKIEFCQVRGGYKATLKVLSFSDYYALCEDIDTSKVAAFKKMVHGVKRLYDAAVKNLERIDGVSYSSPDIFFQTAPTLTTSITTPSTSSVPSPTPQSDSGHDSPPESFTQGSSRMSETELTTMSCLSPHLMSQSFHKVPIEPIDVGLDAQIKLLRNFRSSKFWVCQKGYTLIRCVKNGVM